MKTSGIMGFALVAVIALLGVWAYNKFSGKNIAQLGVPDPK